MAVDVQAIRDKDEPTLAAEVRELEEQLFKLRWQASMGQIENPNKIREVRKTIARNLTVLGEKSRAARSEAR